MMADVGYGCRCRLLWPMSAIWPMSACRLLSPMSAIIADVGYVYYRRLAIIADVGARLLSPMSAICRLLWLMSAVVADVG
jgi:hypothetical protein